MGADLHHWVTEVVDVEVARLRGTARWRGLAAPSS
jgi:hypothetical protein